MRVNREQLLLCLNAVSPGLAKREIGVEQSSCFVFCDDQVQTFNDEVACCIASPLKITGAVSAASFWALLDKLPEDELDFVVEGNELLVSGRSRRARFRLEAEVMLPIDSIEQPEESAWADLPADFCEAIDLVGQCASQDTGSDFSLTCVHLHPKWLEANDNYQISRYPCKTPIQEPCLVRQASIKSVTGQGVTQIAESAAWIHFRAIDGLVLSVRRWCEPYADLTPFLKIDGAKTTLPGGLAEAVALCEIFTADNPEGNHVQVDMKENRLRLKGKGAAGQYEERKKVVYDGPPLSFLISPKLLAALVAKSKECIVAPGRLLIKSGKLTYVACLIMPDDQEQEVAEEQVEEEQVEELAERF